MEKAKQAKSLAKEKNQNLKEIEELRQRRETNEIQKTKVIFKRNINIGFNPYKTASWLNYKDNIFQNYSSKKIVFKLIRNLRS